MKMVKTTVTKSKYTKKCFMCKRMLINKCYLEGIKLELICIKCAMKGFKFPHEALYNYKGSRGKVIINDFIAKKDKKLQEKKRNISLINRRLFKLRSNNINMDKNKVVCQHKWGNSVTGPMTLSEIVIGDFLIGNKPLDITDREFWIKKNSFRTTGPELSLMNALIPMSEFVHKADPVMAMGYLVNKCQVDGVIVKNKIECKNGFDRNCDLLKKVVDIEGVRIASFLYEDHHFYDNSNGCIGIHVPQENDPSPFKILDKAFSIIHSGCLLKSELELQLGSIGANKLMEKRCFQDIIMRFQSNEINNEKARYDSISKEMIEFNKSTLCERKKKAEHLLDCYESSFFAKCYISGEMYFEIRELDLIKKIMKN